MKLLQRYERWSDAFCLFLTIAGIGLMWIYMDNIRRGGGASFSIFLAGVSLCSVSILISYLSATESRVSPISLFSLYLLSYSLLTLSSFRYDFFNGQDVIAEYNIAMTTLSQNQWRPELLSMGKQYASLLSVTILPAALSKISGVETLQLFRFIFPMVGAFVPVMLFLVVREIFEDSKIAFLSAVLFSTSHHQIFMLSYLFREQFAHFFLLLSLYSFLKFRRQPILALLLLPGIVFSHYLTADFALVVFMGFIIAPYASRYLGKGLGKEVLSVRLLAYYVVIMIIWLAFASFSLFEAHTLNISNLLSFVFEYTPAFASRILTTGSFGRSGELGRGLSVGFLLSIWYYLTLFLIACGWLYGLLKVRNDSKRMAWMVCFIFLFSLFLMSSLLPVSMKGVDSQRVYAIGFLFFSSFLALTLVSVQRSRRRFVKLLKFLPMVFILISLPMNMSLPEHQRILHYHDEDSIPPNIRIQYYDMNIVEMEFASWVSESVPDSDWISGDYRGYVIAMLSNHSSSTYLSYPTFSVKSRFLIVRNSYFKYGTWLSFWEGVADVYPSHNISWTEMAKNGSIVYDNGEYILFER